jgi:hypothetical protein
MTMISPVIQRLLATERVVTAKRLFGMSCAQDGGELAQHIGIAGDTNDLMRHLGRGLVHEWFGFPHGPDQPAGNRQQTRWHPPLGICTLLARAALGDTPSDQWAGGAVLWIGRRCWPMAAAMGDLVRASILVDPPDDSARVWMIDEALRCEGVGVVVADGSGIEMAQSRRLQLAAEAGGMGGAGKASGVVGVLGLLVRPPWEIKGLSGASTRWTVSPCRTEGNRERWKVELQRCKGAAPLEDGARRWIVERVREGPHAPDSLRVSADVVNRPGRAAVRNQQARIG